MATEVEIGITTIENTIEITSQSTDQVVDIGVTDNRDEVTINVTPTIIEININKNIPAENNLVTSVNTRIGDVVIDANDVGLGNVDNTGDFQKPISEDVQVALNSKADLIDGLVPESQLPVTALSVMSGLSQGGVLSINTDTAKFDVSAGFGYIVNGHTNPDVPIKNRVPIAASTANVLPNIGSTPQTFVSIDINGVLNLTPNPLTPTERRNFIRLGVIIHLNNTTIEFIDNQPTVNIEVGGQVQDLLEAFGFRSLSGNRIFPVAANLKIKKELGKVFKAGANFRNLSTQPHTFTLAAQDPITFRYRTQTGAEGSDITDINPGIFDSNGTVTAMPATATLASIQRIFIFQDGLIRIQLGQRFFNNLNEAITAINSDVFITDSDISENGLYLGAIVMIRGTTALNNLAQAVFVPSNGVSANGSTSAAPLGYTAEDAANKQNSLVVDGTGAKYPTVDAINAEAVKLTGNQNITGLKTFTNDVKVSGINFGRGSGSISSNSAAGVDSLSNNTTGFNNSAFGENTLKSNVSSSNSTAIGRGVLALSTGGSNTSVGSQSSAKITVGSNNTVIGKDALANSTTAANNFAGGLSAMLNNVGGSENVSVGFFSMLNTNANSNTAVGSYAILGNTNGINNASFGHSSGRFIADKLTAASIVNNSVFLGYRSSPLASNQTNQVVVGYDATGLGSNTSVLGNTSTVFGRFWGRLLVGTSVDNGVDALQVIGSAKVSSSLQVGDNTGAATAINQGAIRYRTDSNNSFIEMSMQTGATAYAWVIIKQNTF
jgi:hypothetical protein